MQLKLAFRLALLLGTFGANQSSAFVVTPKRHGYRIRLSAKPGQSQGWDNENYLEALSTGKDALEKANEEYYNQSDFQKQQKERMAAAPETHDVPKTAAQMAEEFRLTEELKKKIEAAHEEGPDGTRLKELLKVAQQKIPSRPLPMEPPMYVPPVPQPLPATTPVNPDALSVEEQARMFREMMQRQQQGQGPPQPPQYDPYYVTPARPSRPDPRPVGRNRDADAISNTSDLYLAQLKYDSSVRNVARYRGDVEKANAVFQDEGIQKLKDDLLKNPYLTSAPQSLIGTSAEEALYVKMTLEDERAPPVQIDVTSAGISYKEKLRQRQLQMQGQPSETKTESTPVEVKASPAIPVAAATVVPPAATVPAAAAPATVTPPQPQVATPPPATTPTVASTTTTPPPQQVSSSPPASSASPSTTYEVSSSTDTDELRGEIRTLMGLLLKHRGGPGFGAGRLKGPEIERFERLLSQLTGKLQVESGNGQSQAAIPVATVGATTPSVSTSAPKQAPPPQPRQQAVRQQPQPVAQAATAALSPPQPAVSTSSAISMAETVPAGERIQRMISCIEGAIQMYKNSPPELQEGLLIPVRSALMTAVTTCNQVIAENELRNYEAYKALAGPVAPSLAAPPSQYFDVVQVQGDDEYDEDEQVLSSGYDDEEVTFSTSSTAELDGNSKILEKIYQDLKAAAGDGKLGLKPNLTAEEASNLSNSLLDMRAILMEELDSGIPVAQQSRAASTASDNGNPSANSNYQQLLSKARASKSQN